MSIFAISLIIFFGIILILVEFLVVPGITIAGIGGFLMVGGGVYAGYHYHDTKVGNIILLFTVLALILALVFTLKLKTWKRVGLQSEIDGQVNTLDENFLHPGDSGKTISRLAPMGKALFKEKMFEVKSEGGFIDQNTEIVIIRISKNQIIVEPKK
jgi:membrane-bound ClpP family serine protease